MASPSRYHVRKIEPAQQVPASDRILVVLLSLLINLTLVVVLANVRLSPLSRPRDVVAELPTQPRQPLEQTFPLAVAGEDRPPEAQEQLALSGRPELSPRPMVQRTSVAAPDEPAREGSVASEQAVPPAPHLAKKRLTSAPRQFPLPGRLSSRQAVEPPRQQMAAASAVVGPEVVAALPAVASAATVTPRRAGPAEVTDLEPRELTGPIDRSGPPPAAHVRRATVSLRDEPAGPQSPDQAQRGATAARHPSRPQHGATVARMAIDRARRSPSQGEGQMPRPVPGVASAMSDRSAPANAAAQLIEQIPMPDRSLDASPRAPQPHVALLQRSSQKQPLAGGLPDPAELSPSGAEGQGQPSVVRTIPPASGQRRATATTSAALPGATSEQSMGIGPSPAGPRASASAAASGLVKQGTFPRQTFGPRGSLGADSLPMPLSVPADAGGMGRQRSPEIGLPGPAVELESVQLADSSRRFLQRQPRGPLAVRTEVVLPTPAFETRLNRQGVSPTGGEGRPSAQVEAAIDLGLEYLARQQTSDGRWRLERAGDPPKRSGTIRSDTAATALALLSFLGAGYHHRSQQYGPVVRDGLQFLIENQQDNGDLYVPSDRVSNQSAWLYSHGIAAIALCEAYGMTQDPSLRQPAQRAVDFIVAAQHPSRGGWRYQPAVGSDTSVSGWMVMALRSAELANLHVPDRTWQGVENWLDQARDQGPQSFLYRYNPLAPDTIRQRHGRQPTKVMTAVGLLMRLYAGWRRDHADMIAGGKYLQARLPQMGEPARPQRDTYYWYYATQVMFHLGGEPWEQWNGQLQRLLLDSQIPSGALAGSWEPRGPIPDRWAAFGGRLYVTTLNLLSLEVYYRHLPIYADTPR